MSPKDVIQMEAERLIDRQVRAWESERALAEEEGAVARRRTSRLPEGPWIAISKQVGSDATAIGTLIGERLGWQVFDREIVEAIARETHTREQILSRLDEHAVGKLDDLLAQLFVPEDPGQFTYVREMTRIIWALSRQGHVIVMGHGANWLLDSRYGVSVRPVAAFRLRVERVAEREGISVKEATRQVREADRDRAAFIRQVYHRKIDDPIGYDLVLNTGTIDVETAAEAVIATMKRKLGGPF